ncbi:hypothetical protein OAK19_00335 [Aureispira]|nr:hypothetical protein [Aureispira sp.]
MRLYKIFKNTFLCDTSAGLLGFEENVRFLPNSANPIYAFTNTDTDGDAMNDYPVGICIDPATGLSAVPNPPACPAGGCVAGTYCSGGECGVKRDYRGKSLAQYIIDIHSNLVFDWDKYFVVNAQPNAFAKYIMYFSNPIKLNTDGVVLNQGTINNLAPGAGGGGAYAAGRRASSWNDNARRKWYIPANGLFAWKVPLLWKMFGEQNSIPDETPSHPGADILTSTYDRSLPRGLAPSEGLDFVPWAPLVGAAAAVPAGGGAHESYLKLFNVWPESSARTRPAQDGRQGPVAAHARFGGGAAFIHELTAVDAEGIRWDTCEPTAVMIKLGKLLTKDNGLGFWSPEPYICSMDPHALFFAGAAANAGGGGGALIRTAAGQAAGVAAGWDPIFWDICPGTANLTYAQVMRRSWDPAARAVMGAPALGGAGAAPAAALAAQEAAQKRIFQLIYVIQLFYKKNNTPAAIGRCVNRIIPVLDNPDNKNC